MSTSIAKLNYASNDTFLDANTLGYAFLYSAIQKKYPLLTTLKLPTPKPYVTPTWLNATNMPDSGIRTFIDKTLKAGFNTLSQKISITLIDIQYLGATVYNSARKDIKTFSNDRYLSLKNFASLMLDKNQNQSLVIEPNVAWLFSSYTLKSMFSSFYFSGIDTDVKGAGVDRIMSAWGDPPTARNIGYANQLWLFGGTPCHVFILRQQGVADQYMNISYNRTGIGSNLFTNSNKGNPNYLDIKQGAVGDCYFLAALATIAAFNPSFIKDMITTHAQEKYEKQYYSVRFYRPWETPSNAQQYVLIDETIPYVGSTLLGNQNATVLWATLIEKAWAQYQGYFNPTDPNPAIDLRNYFDKEATGASYSMISGGYCDAAMNAIAGSSIHEKITSYTNSNGARFWNTTSNNSKKAYIVNTSLGDIETYVLENTIRQDLSQKDNMTYNLNVGEPDTIISTDCGDVKILSEHAYGIVGSYTDANGGLMLQLFDPHLSNYGPKNANIFGVSLRSLNEINGTIAIDSSHKMAPVGNSLRDHVYFRSNPVDIQTNSAFVDPNKQTLTYSATGLPSWLQINSTTGRITNSADLVPGTYHIQETVTNTGGLTSTIKFDIIVWDYSPSSVFLSLENGGWQSIVNFVATEVAHALWHLITNIVPGVASKNRPRRSVEISNSYENKFVMNGNTKLTLTGVATSDNITVNNTNNVLICDNQNNLRTYSMVDSTSCTSGIYLNTEASLELTGQNNCITLNGSNTLTINGQATGDMVCINGVNNTVTMTNATGGRLVLSDRAMLTLTGNNKDITLNGNNTLSLIGSDGDTIVVNKGNNYISWDRSIGGSITLNLGARLSLGKHDLRSITFLGSNYLDSYQSDPIDRITVNGSDNALDMNTDANSNSTITLNTGASLSYSGKGNTINLTGDDALFVTSNSHDNTVNISGKTNNVYYQGSKTADGNITLNDQANLILQGSVRSITLTGHNTLINTKSYVKGETITINGSDNSVDMNTDVGTSSTINLNSGARLTYTGRENTINLAGNNYLRLKESSYSNTVNAYGNNYIVTYESSHNIFPSVTTIRVKEGATVYLQGNSANVELCKSAHLYFDNDKIVTFSGESTDVYYINSVKYTNIKKGYTSSIKTFRDTMSPSIIEQADANGAAVRSISSPAASSMTESLLQAMASFDTSNLGAPASHLIAANQSAYNSALLATVH